MRLMTRAGRGKAHKAAMLLCVIHEFLARYKYQCIAWLPHASQHHPCIVPEQQRARERSAVASANPNEAAGGTDRPAPRARARTRRVRVRPPADSRTASRSILKGVASVCGPAPSCWQAACRCFLSVPVEGPYNAAAAGCASRPVTQGDECLTHLISQSVYARASLTRATAAADVAGQAARLTSSGASATCSAHASATPPTRSPRPLLRSPETTP